MIELVAAALSAAGLEPTWEDVADTLWLAQQIGRSESPAEPAGTTPEDQPISVTPPETGRARPDSSEPPQPEEERADIGMSPATAEAGLHLPPAPGTATPPSGLPFRTPTATALPGALALGHALRPLKRRVPSPTTLVLDEEATAERAAKDGIWTPVLRPALTRWLDLALVIDQSPSMGVWARTVEDLRRLLECHGAFRDVRIWLLNTNRADGRSALYAGTESATSHARSSTPRELVDPGQRRLILVVSDCVAPAWSSGAVAALLHLWGRTNPVAVVHMLPQRLWRYTAIETEPAELRAPQPGAPNARLDVASWSTTAERQLKVALAADGDGAAVMQDETLASLGADGSAVPVPVVALQPQWLAPWASLVAGAGGRQVPAVVTWAKPWLGEPPDTPEEVGLEPPPATPSPPEGVQRFRALVSPTAFELAGYLAAVPLTLPVMRLVQQAMLPGSAQVHLAEVILGGLLEQSTPTSMDVHPDQVEYDFVDGVRELLLSTVPGTDILRVLHTVGDFVGHRAGRTQTFPSLLYAPDEAAGSAEERAFAAVTARTLRQFGTSFDELADRLEQQSVTDVKQEFPAGEDETTPTSETETGMVAAEEQTVSTSAPAPAIWGRHGVVMEDRFTRLFPYLPAGRFDHEDLEALAGAMIAPPEEPEPEGQDDPEENKGIPAAYTYLGQFVDHDLTFDPISHLRETLSNAQLQALVDLQTPRFDLDNLYGRGPDDQHYLYDEDGIHLLLGEPLSGDPFDPDAVQLLRGPNGRALIGDPRNDDNRIVAQLHAIFLRFHNELADRLGGKKHVSFREVRDQVLWHYQWILVNDFLPTILNTQTYQAVFPDPFSFVTTIPRLRENDLELMPVEFSVAAYRFGHSMIRPRYRLNPDIERPIFSSAPGDAADLKGLRPIPVGWAIDWRFFIDLGHGAGPAPQFSYKIDTSLVHPLGNLPPQIARDPSSLALRNLERGAAFQLPSGQQVAAALGIPPIPDEELVIGMATADGVRKPITEVAPGLAGNAPLWAYILSEAQVMSWRNASGAVSDETPIRLGPVGGPLVAEVFASLLRGDRTSYLYAEPAFKPIPDFTRNGRFGLAELINVALGLQV